MRRVATAAFTLEPQTVAHADAMFDVLSDPAIYEHENAPPASREWLRERFARLESRRSADGRQQWLNWVIRLPSSALAGYVQASVDADGGAMIAYELTSVYWGRGLGRAAVDAMIGELVEHHHVRRVSAIGKHGNLRSRKMLERLDFTPATPAQYAAARPDADEWLMCREIR
ncbi:MAG: GNAT family N-acetyltransferase [Betaproteobacteria bacterium]